MSNKRWIGLTTIKLGVKALSTQGAYMPSTFTTISNIVPDSARFYLTKPEATKLYVEDSYEPDVVVSGGESDIGCEFATRDMDFNSVLVIAFGGTTATSIYSFPTAQTVIRAKAVELTSIDYNGDYFKIEIPNALIEANADLKMYNLNPDTGQIGFKLTAMKAVSAGGTVVAPFKITRV